MNKKLNTALFFTVATVVNVALVAIMTIILFRVWYFAAGLVFGAHQVTLQMHIWALMACILAGLGISFPLYKWLVVWFQKKVDVDKYFENSVKLLVRKSLPRDKFGQR